MSSQFDTKRDVVPIDGELAVTRRGLLETAAAAGFGTLLTHREKAAIATSGKRKNPIPRWRGFNLLDFFQALRRGECGGYNKTPHDVFFAWMSDALQILKRYEIGWALWNLRGSFGVLDSDRADVKYEDFHGRKLDHKLLALLQQH